MTTIHPGDSNYMTSQLFGAPYPSSNATINPVGYLDNKALPSVSELDNPPSNRKGLVSIPKVSTNDITTSDTGQKDIESKTWVRLGTLSPRNEGCAEGLAGSITRKRKPSFTDPPEVPGANKRLRVENDGPMVIGALTEELVQADPNPTDQGYQSPVEQVTELWIDEFLIKLPESNKEGSWSDTTDQILLSPSVRSRDRKASCQSDLSHQNDRVNNNPSIAPPLKSGEIQSGPQPPLSEWFEERQNVSLDIGAQELWRRRRTSDMIFNDTGLPYHSQAMLWPPRVPEALEATVSLRDIETRGAEETTHLPGFEPSLAQGTSEAIAEPQRQYGFDSLMVREIKILVSKGQWKKAMKLLPSEQVPPRNTGRMKSGRWRCRVKIWVDSAGDVSYGNCAREYRTRDNLARHVGEEHFGKERAKPKKKMGKGIKEEESDEADEEENND